jgi:SAM-dependent methyltransferase
VSSFADKLDDRAFHIFMRAADAMIDAAYGVHTLAERRYTVTDAAATRYRDPATNMPSYYLRLRALRDALELTPQDALVDLGCGCGRALSVFARRPLRYCRGVEFELGAATVARANARRLRGRRAAIDIITGDAAEYPFSDETLVYLFNPFGADTLRAVLANLRRSLELKPRRLRLCYYNPKHGDLLQAAGWLRRTATLRGFKTHIEIFEPAAQ